MRKRPRSAGSVEMVRKEAGPTLMRPLATTLARPVADASRIPSLVVSMPRCATGILGDPNPEMISWSITPHGCLLSAGSIRGAMPVKVQDKLVITIPKPLMRKLRIRDGQKMNWHVAAFPGARWGLFVVPGLGTDLGTPARGRQKRISRRLLDVTPVYKNYNKKRRASYMTNIPRVCLKILMAGNKEWIRWEKTGQYYNIVLSAPYGPYARKVQSKIKHTRKGAFRTSYHGSMHNEVVRHLDVQRSPSIGWYVVADGLGRWEIHVGPGNRLVSPQDAARGGMASGVGRDVVPETIGGPPMTRKITRTDPRRLDWRPLTTSLVRYNTTTGSGNKGLITSIPLVVRETFGIKHPKSVSWPGTGGFRPVILHRKRVEDAPITYGSTETMIPREMIAAMHLRDGDTMEWVLVASGGKIRVHVKRQKSRARPPMRPRRRGITRPARMRLTTTRISRRKVRKFKYVYAVIPRICLSVLLALDTTHVRWERAGRRFRVVPCKSGDEGARRLTRSYSTSKNATHMTMLPKRVASSLYTGSGSRLGWYAVAHPRAGWDIEVGRA